MAALERRIANSDRVTRLLNLPPTSLKKPVGAYTKWQGAHWVLVDLAEMGMPRGDERLAPLRDQVYDWLLSPGHVKGIPVINGLARMHASQESNAVFATLKLGIADHRVEQLMDNLLKRQWPDGGWNCDKRSRGKTSSFMETITPLRSLIHFAKQMKSDRARLAAENAAEVFLGRKLYKSNRDGSVIRDDFLSLHFPCYWHYDILHGLKVMAEGGFIDDPRCGDALDLLESKRLADGGFSAEKKYYHISERRVAGVSSVDWGGTSKIKMNPWITSDALCVLKAAGRI